MTNVNEAKKNADPKVKKGTSPVSCCVLDLGFFADLDPGFKSPDPSIL